jgi:DNA-binding NarL/FixJ family response regulator
MIFFESVFMTKVIVIDDEQDITDVFSEYLRLKDVEVIANGHNGKEAAELYEKLKPDVVLMDLVMPDYDGFYGIKKIKETDPNAKIIIFSASLTPDYIERLKELNVSGITRKPYDMDNVIQMIDKVKQGAIIDLTPLT